MRVSEEARVTAQRREEGRRGDFGAALKRAEARRAEAERADAGRAERRTGERLAETRGAEARGRDGGAAGDAARAGAGPGSAGQASVAGAAGGAGGAGAGVWAEGGDAARAGGSGGASGPAGPGAPGEPVPTGAAVEPERAALAQAVRALPPVIEAFRAAGQAALAIDFGRSLGVELRQAAGGVELRLSASAALRPAARLELQQLCRALAARGVTVASAEVRGGRPGSWGP